MYYDLLTPRQIIFGWGRRAELPSLTASLGRRAIVIHSSRTLAANGTITAFTESITQAGLELVTLQGVSHEPEVTDVDRVVAELTGCDPRPGDVVIGIGGGAGLDLAKAVAAMAVNADGHSVQDFLEGVGCGRQLTQDPLPMIAIPTTAGTGTEATKNAVISCYDPKFKKSLRSPRMVPAIALIDPELTCSVPRAQTASSGMDAITQLIESAISCRAQPIPQALCREGLRGALPAIRQAYDQPDHRPARTQMAHAAMLSGIALANSGLGLAHGVAAALGVHARVPHGLACAVMLPVALRTNRDVSLDTLAALARESLPDCPHATAAAVDALIAHITELNHTLEIPSRLSELGVVREQLPDIVVSSHGNSLSGNPRPIGDDELTDILEACL